MGYSFHEVLAISANVAILAISYTIFGALLSYIFYFLFDEFDDGWKKKTVMYQLTDILVEVGLVALSAFWSAQFVKVLPQIIPIKRSFSLLVDNYISGIFFIYAIFLFLDDLSEKIKFINNKLLGKHFEKLFPMHGSIIDGTLSYSKTD